MTAVSAVVVHREGREMLRDCLRSLEEAEELIVVDNGSTDGSREMVERDFPRARVLALGSNRGFAPAVNAGVRSAGGEWVLTLNDDATAMPGAVGHLLSAASSPDVFSVAAQMRFASAPHVINSAGISVDRLGVARDRLVGLPVPASESGVTEVFGASAGAALFRRSMLLELGGLDESFVAYLEDVDLAWRARMRGWRSLYAPGAVVLHRHSATSRHRSASKHRLVGRNRVRLLAKNADSGMLRRRAPALLLYDAASRRPVELEPPAGLRAALRRRRAWARYSADANGATQRAAVPADAGLDLEAGPDGPAPTDVAPDLHP